MAAYLIRGLVLGGESKTRAAAGCVQDDEL
ncbi:MAG: hypothetical protein ACI9KE_003548 [Polyangiales bacterium]|jgi:hypothetical protein